MGSFNATCSITNLPITCGDPVILFVLKKVSWADFRKVIECDDLWSPFCMPIYGTYDDYGCIKFDDKDIVNQMNWKYIREQLVKNNLKITADEYDRPKNAKNLLDFLKIIERTRIEDIGYMLVHAEIVDILINEMNSRETKSNLNISDKTRKEFLDVCDNGIQKVSQLPSSMLKHSNNFIEFMNDSNLVNCFTRTPWKLSWFISEYIKTKSQKLLDTMINFYVFNIALSWSRHIWQPSQIGSQSHEMVLQKIIAEYVIKEEDKKRKELLSEDKYWTKKEDHLRFVETYLRETFYY